MEAPYTTGNTAGPLPGYMYVPSYPTYCNPVHKSQGNRKRQDSMLQNTHMALRPVAMSSNTGRTQHPDTNCFTRTTSTKQTQTPSEADRQSQVQAPKQDAFRFCVTTNPQVKDKAEMRENRKHVMHDFLRKEGRKTSGLRDARAAGQAQPDKRRRLESSTVEASKSLNPAAPCHMFGPGVLTPQSSCDGTSSVRHWNSETEETTMSITDLPASQISCGMLSDPAYIPHSQPVREEDEERNNAEDVSETEAQASGTGDLFSLLGFRVGPYHSFFQATRPHVDLEKMKYDCGRRLRSESMLAVWLPAIARTKHCFLSTICISAAHEEAMREFAYETGNLHALQRSAVYETLAVKSQVHGMVNAVLDDPEQRTSDDTIIAVMNMLNSEMIGCDLKALRVHQDGLHSMVRMRGGLGGLGVHGHLARTLTISMLVNSILQEKVADDMYLHYAQRQAAPSTTNGTTSRASMFYCGVLEWADLSRFLSPSSDTMALLNLVRKLTGAFRRNGDSRASDLQNLRNEIWRYKQKTSTSLPAQEDRVYEAVRLTARLYANALAGGVPFSSAWSATESKTNNGVEHRPAAFVQIAQALINTNLQDFWGGLSGVLFWIGLSAGAAARGARIREADSTTNLARRQQEDAASRLLSAVAVRGSIVFGFEQGSAVLGSLSNMLDLQGRLSGRQSFRPKGRAAFGPDRLRQSGFGDWAQEFRSAAE
ncbi:hypothetical protein Q7P37_001181 [Cladosporium fusiforme]